MVSILKAVEPSNAGLIGLQAIRNTQTHVFTQWTLMSRCYSLHLCWILITIQLPFQLRSDIKWICTCTKLVKTSYKGTSIWYDQCYIYWNSNWKPFHNFLHVIQLSSTRFTLFLLLLELRWYLAPLLYSVSNWTMPETAASVHPTPLQWSSRSVVASRRPQECVEAQRVDSPKKARTFDHTTWLTNFGDC